MAPRLLNVKFTTTIFTAFLVPLSPLAADVEIFKKHIAPFLEANCTDCHDAETQKGKVELHTIGGDFSNGDNV
ncbi:MAG: hypothetical protein HN869_10875, partial [Verrucomicrobia bacterium]|nr:hypothetical protein [Verrucomicrobiota bacterium]